MELMWKLGECAPKDIVAQYDEPQPHVNTVAMVVQSLEDGKGSVTEPMDIDDLRPGKKDNDDTEWKTRGRIIRQFLNIYFE